MLRPLVWALRQSDSCAHENLDTQGNTTDMHTHTHVKDSLRTQ